MQINNGSFGRPRAVADKPRKVRGGLKFTAEWPPGSAWEGVAARWAQLVARAAGTQAMSEGLEYAREGQARELSLDAGVMSARVQGRRYSAYRVRIEMAAFGEAQWRVVSDALSEQSGHAAALISGQLPEETLAMFDGLGLPMLPAIVGDLKVSCECGPPSASGGTWCKHVVCTGLLVGQEFMRRATGILAVRGIGVDELVERVRERRGGQRSAPSPGSVASVLGANEARVEALESCVERFWEAGAGLDRVTTAVRGPEVRHALLRRLGPSPFEGSKFPMVGLLATCYDLVTERALSGEGEGRSGV